MSENLKNELSKGFVEFNTSVHKVEETLEYFAAVKEGAGDVLGENGYVRLQDVLERQVSKIEPQIADIKMAIDYFKGKPFDRMTSKSVEGKIESIIRNIDESMEHLTDIVAVGEQQGIPKLAAEAKSSIEAAEALKSAIQEIQQQIIDPEVINPKVEQTSKTDQAGTVVDGGAHDSKIEIGGNMDIMGAGSRSGGGGGYV